MAQRSRSLRIRKLNRRPLIIDGQRAFHVLQIERLRAEHEAEDPFALWAAIFHARHIEAMPTWTLIALDNIREKLLRACLREESSRDWKDGAADALGFRVVDKG